MRAINDNDHSSCVCFYCDIISESEIDLQWLRCSAVNRCSCKAAQRDASFDVDVDCAARECECECAQRNENEIKIQNENENIAKHREREEQQAKLRECLCVPVRECKCMCVCKKCIDSLDEPTLAKESERDRELSKCLE